MKMLEKMFNNDSFKNAIFSRLAKQAKENGIKQMLITIEDDGNFKTDIVTDELQLIKKSTHDYLKDFYSRHKHRPGSNYPDTIKK